MWRSAWIACVVVALGGRAAEAQDASYQPYPMGERALGMGGAFTSVAGDPISTYYNPAGIVFGGSSAMSASLNVYGMTHRTVEDGGFFLAFEPDPVDPDVAHPLVVDLEYSEFPPATIPISTVIVRRIGRRADDGSRRHAFAWSTLIPRASDLQYSLDITNDFDGDPWTAPDQHRITFREADKLMLIGATYAYRLTDRLSMGLSVFCGIRTYSHSYHHTFFNSDPSPELRGIQVREVDVAATVYTGIFRIGALWQLTRSWRLGLMVALPSFEISSEGYYALRDLETFGGTFELAERRDATPHDVQPLEIRAGVSREVPGSYVVSLDVAFYAPASYDRFDEAPGWTGLTWVHRVERDPIANVNIGGEVIVARDWPIRLGFFTDFSAAPEIVPSDRPTVARIHSFGGTLSVGYTGHGFGINIGLLGSIGTGHAQTVGPVGPDLPTYVPTRAQERRLYFFISGAREAAERAVGDVIDRIEERE
jgi:long-chain fatty acid transport protein